MQDRPLHHARAIFVALVVVRALVHWAAYRDAEALLQIASLDLGAVIVMTIAFALVPRIGTYFASVSITAIGLGLVIAALGWAAEYFDGRHLSKLMGCVCVLGIGVGCCAVPHRRVLGAVGGLALAGGTYGLVALQAELEAVLIAAPAVLTSAWSVLRGWGEVDRREPTPEPR